MGDFAGLIAPDPNLADPDQQPDLLENLVTEFNIGYVKEEGEQEPRIQVIFRHFHPRERNAEGKNGISPNRSKLELPRMTILSACFIALLGILFPAGFPLTEIIAIKILLSERSELFSAK